MSAVRSSACVPIGRSSESAERATAGRRELTRTVYWPPEAISNVPAAKSSPESWARRAVALGRHDGGELALDVLGEAHGVTSPGAGRRRPASPSRDGRSRLRGRGAAWTTRTPCAASASSSTATGAAPLGPVDRGELLRDGRVVDEHVVDHAGGAVTAEGAEMVGRRVAVGLARLGHDVADVDHPGPRALERVAHLGDQQVRHDARVHAARSEHDEIGGRDRLEGLRQRPAAGPARARRASAGARSP